MAADSGAAPPGPWLGDLSPDELENFNGRDANKPLLVAIRGMIYNVSSAGNFYGPEGPYAPFAGRDASRALALMSVEEAELSSSLDGLTEKQVATLDQWEAKFRKKYPVVGKLVARSQV